MNPRPAKVDRWRSIFAQQDAGPWTCPECHKDHPWHRFTLAERARLEMVKKTRTLLGAVEYSDGSLRCMLCLAFRSPDTGTPTEETD